MKKANALNTFKNEIAISENKLTAIEDTKLTQVTGGDNIPPWERPDNVPPCIDGINSNGVYIGVN